MKSKWYRITGITEKMYEAWKDELRQDLIVWQDDDVICVRVLLNPLEALLMKIQMRFTNKKLGTRFQLKELKWFHA